jgi:glycosyltransferase involved in cell wall biosynthesis
VNRPTLTLCLIARDEEALLPACLASVRGVVDQIIVADTGSTDRTAALALQAGAEVIDHPWQSDFSAARNAALSAATGDWILVLDADERLSAGSGAVIRQAIQSGGFDLGFLSLHNASSLEGGHPREHRPLVHRRSSLVRSAAESRSSSPA